MTTPHLKGFAAMDPALRLECARKGGAAQKAESRSFYRDRELAARAGRKGGAASNGGGRRKASTDA